MSARKYINHMKALIEERAKEYSASNRLTPDFFKNLYSEIKVPIQTVAKIFKMAAVDDETLFTYYETAKKEYLSIHPIDIEPTSTLTKDGFKTWLTQEREKCIQWEYTNRYIDYLRDKGRSEQVIREIESSSRVILGNLGDPKRTDAFYVKGLVVGEVQSGKTENFNSVINRSIDCGYKLIIVLSGIMEDLRYQTQGRIDEEVIGEGKIGVRGVGNFKRFGPMGRSDVEQLESITSGEADFNRNLLEAGFSLSGLKLLVCKKNNSVLRNLIVGLHDYFGHDNAGPDIPLLLLDDEADNASLNNEGAKGREYASTINGHIRALLQLFPKKSYLGYTATPFANVLQDRNPDADKKWVVKYKLGGVDREKQLDQVSNIFPDDFISLLSSPSNYIGAKQIFETVTPIDNKENEKIPLVHIVEDHIEHFPSRVIEEGIIPVENFQEKAEWDARFGESGRYLNFSNYKEYRAATRASQPLDSFPEKLPESLVEAILCFILSIAVRDSRKPQQLSSYLYQRHNTMLIHISRFTKWQNKTAELVEIYIRDIKARIENEKPSEPDSIYFKLKKIWFRYYAEIIEKITDYLPEGYIDEFMVPIAFDSLIKYVPEAVQDIETLAINSSKNHELKYSKNNPRKIIAIGGNRLSRGFTIEGLTINYFVRSTNYSDTLLQMGRWFGYRPGYLDCCKIFTTQDSEEKFDSTTKCIEELEGEFRTMEDLGKSPNNFILKVRKHSGVLKITRQSILKNATAVRGSYQNRLVMTSKFDVRKEKLERVWDVFRNEIAPKFDPQKKEKSQDFFTFHSRGIEVINFLNLENNIDRAERFSMIEYIQNCQVNGQLTDWTIAVKRGGRARKNEGKGILTAFESNLPGDVTMAIRRGPNKKPGEDSHRRQFLNNSVFMATGKSANIVSSPKDLSIQLTPAEKADAEKAFRDSKKKGFLRKISGISEKEAQEKADRINPPEKVYREKIKEHQGLLIIYMFDSYYSFNQKKNQDDAEFTQFVNDRGYNLNIPIIGYAIGFPPLENDPGGEYVRGDYDISEDDEYLEEDISPEDSILPDDLSGD
jgi:hypothetical protein